MEAKALKDAVARAALGFVVPGKVLGVGSGSTVAALIAVLAESTVRPRAAVAASDTSSELLSQSLIPVLTLSETGGALALYIDGADEIDPYGRLIKGGGGAHTREKALAQASAAFLCIADESKLVERLGSGWPVPLEFHEETAEQVTAAVSALGGRLEPRLDAAGIPLCADSGNPLGDIFGLSLDKPAAIETELEAILGVVACGIFAHRRADAALIALRDGSLRKIAFSDVGRGLLGRER